MGAIAGKMEFLILHLYAHMNTTQRNGIIQRWRVVQHELIPELRLGVSSLTPKLEKVIHTLEWVRIEEFVESA